MRCGPVRSHRARAKFKGGIGRGASALRGAAILVLAGAVPAAASSQQRTSAPTSLVFDGVSVLDVQTGRLVPAQRVVVVGNRIQAMGSAREVKRPQGARVINARGKYLIPGLWDMHAHMGSGMGSRIVKASSVLEAADHYAIYLAYGVTGVRDVGASIPLDSLLQWRREVGAGTRVGPRVFLSGPYLDSRASPGWGSLTRGFPAALPINTPDEGRRAVDTLKAAGADLIKIHENDMSREVYFAIAAEARRVGIPFVGHLPSTVSMAEASDSGQRSVEHSGTFSGPCMQIDSVGNWPSDSGVKQQCAALIAKFLRNGTWLDPNMVTQDSLRDGRLVRAVRPFGLPFLVGTDIQVTGGLLGTDDLPAEVRIGAPPLVHQELWLFVKAGLTPAEALRVATLNSAKSLNATDSLGSIAPGQLADLVLLDANPLLDIRHTRKIRAVVANGRYFDRPALDAMIAAVKQRTQENEKKKKAERSARHFDQAP
jgi:imidazolonepropionase-like amidohydrolase